jgi:hypothetical protein
MSIELERDGKLYSLMSMTVEHARRNDLDACRVCALNESCTHGEGDEISDMCIKADREYIYELTHFWVCVRAKIKNEVK